MLKRWPVLCAVVVALGMLATLTGPSLAAPAPKTPTVSVTAVNGDPGFCAFKWTARNLQPGMWYGVGIYDGSTFPRWLDAQQADARGTIRAFAGFIAPTDVTDTLRAELVFNGDNVAATDDTVPNRCKAAP